MSPRDDVIILAQSAIQRVEDRGASVREKVETQKVTFSYGEMLKAIVFNESIVCSMKHIKMNKSQASIRSSSYSYFPLDLLRNLSGATEML